MYAYKVIEYRDRKWMSPIYNQEWVFGAKTYANCCISDFTSSMLHTSPDEDCKCGIYGLKDIMQATPYMKGTTAVIAFGWGSGKIIVGEKGYRAAEWEPVYAVDLSPLDALIDEMWDNAWRKMQEGTVQEMAITILGLEECKVRAHKGLADSHEVMLREGLEIISIAQAQILVGDSWET